VDKCRLAKRRSHSAASKTHPKVKASRVSTQYAVQRGGPLAIHLESWSILQERRHSQKS
jgi:hypothetical protein